MSATLHCHQEVLIDNRWEHYGHVGCIKDVELLALCGCLRYKDMIERIHPRHNGWPTDLTKPSGLDLCLWGSDAHTGNWFNPHEVCTMFARFDTLLLRRSGRQLPEAAHRVWIDTFGYLYGISWHNWFNFPDSWKSIRSHGLKDFRWLFFIDG